LKNQSSGDWRYRRVQRLKSGTAYFDLYSSAGPSYLTIYWLGSQMKERTEFVLKKESEVSCIGIGVARM
jgi:hypothetical protein